jgi:hypothetical protein
MMHGLINFKFQASSHPLRNSFECYHYRTRVYCRFTVRVIVLDIYWRIRAWISSCWKMACKYLEDDYCCDAIYSRRCSVTRRLRSELYDVYVSTVWRGPGRFVRCIFYSLHVARFKSYTCFFVPCICKHQQHNLMPISDYTGFPAVVLRTSVVPVGYCLIITCALKIKTCVNVRFSIQDHNLSCPTAESLPLFTFTNAYSVH